MSLDATSWKDITWGDILIMVDSNELYERYKEEWVKDHISDEVMTATEAMYENDEDAQDMTFTEYVEDSGYADGSIYACYNEFIDNEFEVWALASEIEHYLYERGEYEYPEKDRAPWLDKNGDSTKTEANIRAALTAAPQGLFIYIKRDCAALAPEDELMSKAKLLIKTIEEYCPETGKEKVSKPIERD